MTEPTTIPLMTRAELLAHDREVGHALDGRDWTDRQRRFLLAHRRRVRTELERRHVAANRVN